MMNDSAKTANRNALGLICDYVRDAEFSGATSLGRHEAGVWKMNGISYHAELEPCQAFQGAFVAYLTRADGKFAEVSVMKGDLENERVMINWLMYLCLLLNPEMAPQFVDQTGW